MIRLNDPSYVAEQYRDNRNLDARIALHQRFSTARRDFHLWVFDYLRLPDGARVLELGCGTGALWHKNRERIPGSWQLTLSDFSYGMLQTARLNTAFARFVQLDAQTIPFRDNSFDAVVADHMLYHIPDLSRALGEIRRILGSGGKLYAATNGLNHMQEYFQFIADFTGVETPREPLQFTLENGGEQLQKYFPHVERIDFEDGLIVTEVEPLVRYALSGWVGKKWIEPGRETELRVAIAGRIARDGAFRIAKSTGLFSAEK
jgi:SAM-dependent methyltransferase